MRCESVSGFGPAALPPLPAGAERLPNAPHRIRSRLTLTNEPRFATYGDGGPGRQPPDPDHPLYVDRRFRAWPHRGAGPEGALAEPAGRRAGDLAVRAAGGLHAR